MFLGKKNPTTSSPDLHGSESGSDVLARQPQPSRPPAPGCRARSLEHRSFDDEPPAYPQLPPTASPHAIPCLRWCKQQEVLQFSTYFASGKMAACQVPPISSMSALVGAGQRGAGDFRVLRSPF